ncbi:MAG: GNAT family N-acetyltransferase [Vulcanimicrobiaceae bacterium]
MPDSIEIRRTTGAQIVPYLGELARLRITSFREYPYLYDGDRAYEERYLRTYADAPQSIVLVALDGETVVGASTGTPLATETADVRAPFEEHRYPVEATYYGGESLIDPAYRGRGIYPRFLAGREAFAREAGFATCAFCAVDRGERHPARPAGYRPLDAIWTRAGYVCHPELVASYAWKDVGADVETQKPMVFWLKSLAERRA